MVILKSIKKTLQDVTNRLLIVASSTDDKLQQELTEELNDCSVRLKAALTTIENYERSLVPCQTI